MKYFVYCRKSSEGEERQALSIPAQIDEIRRIFGDAPDIEIVEWFEEKMSAKAPGRPVYARMIQRIERGEAHGLIAWHPDRLARNSVDGGWLIYLLDRRVLKDLKFASYTYEQSPQGMFMLQIMFGQSKYYVDNLSVNVKRGQRKKVAMGWLPAQAPLGYRNDRETGTIIRDPERFQMLRRMWDLFLTGAYSPRQIGALANDGWGFRTPRKRKIGGKALSLSGTYRMLSNPFYAGVVKWNDEWRPGKHEPMVTMEEFNRAQALLGRPGRPQPKTHAFAFTGLIKCICGLSVTAEEKVKRSGRRYVYYHCTRRTLPRCRQPSICLQDLESRIHAYLLELHLPDLLERLLQTLLAQDGAEARDLRDRQTASLARSLQQTRQELRTLTDLRVRDLIDDADFTERRNLLLKTELQTGQALQGNDDKPPVWSELAACANLFRKYAADWFLAGNLDDKKMILKTVGSNLVLDEKTLSIQARFPFIRIENEDDFVRWRGFVEAVGTDFVLMEEAQIIILRVKQIQTHADAQESEEYFLDEAA